MSEIRSIARIKECAANAKCDSEALKHPPAVRDAWLKARDDARAQKMVSAFKTLSDIVCKNDFIAIKGR